MRSVMGLVRQPKQGAVWLWLSVMAINDLALIPKTSMDLVKWPSAPFRKWGVII